MTPYCSPTGKWWSSAWNCIFSEALKSTEVIHFWERQHANLDSKCWKTFHRPFQSFQDDEFPSAESIFDPRYGKCGQKTTLAFQEAQQRLRFHRLALLRGYHDLSVETGRVKGGVDVCLSVAVCVSMCTRAWECAGVCSICVICVDVAWDGWASSGVFMYLCMSVCEL